MMRRYILLFGLCLPQLAAASADDSHISVKDIYFGEALYYAYQGRYVDSIPRLDIGFGRFYEQGKPGPDPLHFQFGHSRFSAGDFELSYRMHQRAGNVINAIHESSADQMVRNEAAYRLARIYLENGNPVGALKTIGKIKGRIPEDLREDELFLRAQIYMANGRFADSVKLLQALQNSTGYKGFAAFNLGVAYIRSGQENHGLDQFSKAAEVSGDDDITSSIRDKANLTLGYRML
ncbi:MAG: tetratricopeptide repeat protein, partial [Gallionella sp.]|nr:tetratricopeptide repeat protein [Gallionella sp.]